MPNVLRLIGDISNWAPLPLYVFYSYLEDVAVDLAQMAPVGAPDETSPSVRPALYTVSGGAAIKFTEVSEHKDQTSRRICLMCRIYLLFVE